MQRLNCQFLGAAAGEDRTQALRRKWRTKHPSRATTFLNQPFEAEEAMFEFQDIFANQLTATVFVSASMAMLTAYAIAALALCRGLEKPRPLGSQPRAA
jgi:hypothetical protein